MDETAAFEIISPERSVLSGQAEMIIVPGIEGDFGVLPGHAPFISGLRPGVVTIYEEGAPTQRIFVDGGMAEVTPEGCILLADKATPVQEMDQAAIQQTIRDLQEDIRAAEDEDSRQQAEAQLNLANAQFTALEMEESKSG